MIVRHIGTLAAFVSALVFPWPFTAVLVCGVSFFEPFVPLGVGIFVDTLYYTQHGYAWPLYTVWGVVMTAIALFMRSRLKTVSV